MKRGADLRLTASVHLLQGEADPWSTDPSVCRASRHGASRLTVLGSGGAELEAQRENFCKVLMTAKIQQLEKRFHGLHQQVNVS